jgi:hypothetical protein
MRGTTRAEAAGPPTELEARQAPLNQRRRPRERKVHLPGLNRDDPASRSVSLRSLALTCGPETEGGAQGHGRSYTTTRGPRLPARIGPSTGKLTEFPSGTDSGTPPAHSADAPSTDRLRLHLRRREFRSQHFRVRDREIAGVVPADVDGGGAVHRSLAAQQGVCCRRNAIAPGDHSPR